MNIKKSELLKKFFNDEKSEFFLCLVIFSIITISLFFHPAIRAFWNHSYGDKLWREFVSQVVESNDLDAKSFWEFRERYSPGSFKINPDHIEIFQTFRITSVNDSGSTDILYFQSPRLSSTDTISNKFISPVEYLSGQEVESILFESEDVVIYNLKNSPEKTQIWFIKPIEQMQEANGFFDYSSEELGLIKNCYWINHSVLF